MLTLRGLSKRYGALQVLDEVSFDVRPGRIVGFLGPNGAGKTTTMRSIFGLVRLDAGEIRWRGEAVDHATRLGFGYMPEQRGLYPKMRIAEQLEYVAQLSGLPKDDAADAALAWLERLGLRDRVSERLEALSHGNQQRVQLAAALVHDPEVAVLDEPFSGLDPIGVEAMSQQLRSMAGNGAAIVFSSHQLDLVEDICQDVVIIHEGTVARTGSLADLRAASPHRRLLVTVDGRPWWPSGLQQERENWDSVEPQSAEGRGLGSDATDGHVLISRDVPMEQILAEASRAGTVTSFSHEPPRLADIFHEAVAT